MAGSAGITKVEPTGQTETEEVLEDALVKDPDMLMSDLTLVGRQMPIAGDYLEKYPTTPILTSPTVTWT